MTLGGEANMVVFESEYTDLAAFQTELEAFEADAEMMGLLRSTTEHIVEGTLRSHIERAVPQFA